MRTVVFVLLSLLAFAACQDEGDVSQKGPAQSSATTGAAPQQAEPNASMNPVVPPPASATATGATQEVHLIEYSIHMPDTLPAGHVAFNIENGGKENHGFEIEGNGVHLKSTELSRGNTTSLEADLKPGTYTIWCPVDGHKGKGMVKTVTVK